MDAKTEELRAAHDVLAEFYADRLADALDHMPTDRAVLGLFCDLTLAAGLGTSVGDIGCGTGRLEPYLAARGLFPQGVGLSPGIIRVARRDHPGFGFGIADRGGRTTGLGAEFDIYWMSPDEMRRRVADAGFTTVFWAGRPAEGQEGSPQGYLLVRKP
jgi:SAM-dependent methyltransferase